MGKKLLVWGILTLVVVILFEVFLYAQIISKLPTTKKTANTPITSNTPSTQMCSAYDTLITDQQQKLYLSEVAEGFVAYKNGLIVNLENVIEWQGLIAESLYDEPLVSKSCSGDDWSSCKEFSTPNMYVVTIKHASTSKVDYPIMFNKDLVKSHSFWYRSNTSQDFEVISYDSLLEEFKKNIEAEFLIRRETKFQPWERIFYITKIAQ